MKKSLMLIATLSASFILSSCTGGTNSSNSEANSSPDASQNVPSSEESKGSSEDNKDSSSSDQEIDNPSSSEGETEENPTAWSESDLTYMALYLNGYTSLPFPIGFTSTYVEASGTDEDEMCFIAYDDNSGNLCESYGNQLIEAGFEYLSEDSNPSEEVYYYSLGIEDSIDSILVQADYYQDSFEIFAWIETNSGGSKSETFPYAQIAEYFGKETLTETDIPSFQLAADEQYDYYFSEEGIEYFYVGGIIDSTSVEEEYLASYAQALSTANYVVDEEEQFGTNETLGLEVDYAVFDGYFLVQISKYEKIEAGDHSITFVAEDFPTGYSDTTISKDNISFAMGSVMAATSKDSTYIQFRSASKGSGYFQNTSSISKIVSLVVTATSTDYYGTLSLYVSDSEISETNPGTKIAPTSNGTVFTYAVNTEDAHFFKLINEESYASKNASIVLNYNIA